MVKVSTIAGHTQQQKELFDNLSSENVSHAYLFSGRANLGKMTIAHWFATELLLHGISKEDEPKARHSIEYLIHSDLLVLDKLWIEKECDDWDYIAKFSNVPQTHRSKKPGAKTDVIGIDDIRALQDRLYETGTGTWRCCIIRSIERMQGPAANAFLKILEEPPPGLVFLLTTESLPSLLPTLVSRARVMHFHRLSQKELRPLLAGTPEDEAQFIVHLAQGAPGVAVRLSNDPDVLREQRIMHSKAQSFWKSDSLREKLSLLTPLHQRGEEAEQFFMHLALTLREEQPKANPMRVRALTQFHEKLRSNAHRSLLSQQFALSIIAS